MKKVFKPSVFLILGLFFLLSVTGGCETMQPALDMGAAMGVATGTLSSGQADSLKRTGTAIGKTFQDITPEQEYYIGRAVAATVLGKYRPYQNEQANHYLNLVGQTVALASERPQTFGGYHFLILDSDEINALAAPGGLILVTRGMLRNCKSEDALAAVLAHEIGHIQGRHGLKAIKNSRLTSAFTILAAEGIKNYGAPQLAQLTEAFEGSVGDIVSTVMTSGYSRDLEREADQSALITLKRAGYDPKALTGMLLVMEQKITASSTGFAKTHPSPRERIQLIEARAEAGAPAPAPPARLKRFQRDMGAV
jgi:beta-barrel assembly-enhancing protease